MGAREWYEGVVAPITVWVGGMWIKGGEAECMFISAVWWKGRKGEGRRGWGSGTEFWRQMSRVGWDQYEVMVDGPCLPPFLSPHPVSFLHAGRLGYTPPIYYTQRYQQSSSVLHSTLNRLHQIASQPESHPPNNTIYSFICSLFQCFQRRHW